MADIGLLVDVNVNANLEEPIKLVMEAHGERTIADLKVELKELLRKQHRKWGPITVRSLKAPHKGGLYYLPDAYELQSLVNLGLVGDSLVADCGVAQSVKRKRKVSLEPAVALDWQQALDAERALLPRKRKKEVVKKHASAAAPSPTLQLPQMRQPPAAEPMVPFESAKQAHKTARRRKSRRRKVETEAAAGNNSGRLDGAASQGAATPDITPQALPPNLQAAAGADQGVGAAAGSSREEVKEKEKKGKEQLDKQAADCVKGKPAAEQPEQQRRQEARQAEQGTSVPAEQHISKKQRREEERAASASPPKAQQSQQQHADKAAEQRLARKPRRGGKSGAAAAVEAQAEAQQQVQPEQHQRQGKEVEAAQQEEFLFGTQAASHVPKQPQVPLPSESQGVKPAVIAAVGSGKGNGAKAGGGGRVAKQLASCAGRPGTDVTPAASGSSSEDGGSEDGSSGDSGSDAGADSDASPACADFTRHPSTAGKRPKSDLVQVPPTQEESGRGAEGQEAEAEAAAAEDWAEVPDQEQAREKASDEHAPRPPTKQSSSKSSGSESGSGSESESDSESGNEEGGDAEDEDEGQGGGKTGPKALSQDEAASPPRSGSSAETDSEEEEESPPTQVLTQPSGKFTGDMGFNSIISRFGGGGAKAQSSGDCNAGAAEASQGAAGAAAIARQWAKPHAAYDYSALKKLCRQIVREAVNIERNARGLPKLASGAALYQKESRPDWWPLDGWSSKYLDSKGAAVQVYNAARKVLAAEHDVALEPEIEGGEGKGGKKKVAKR